MHSLPGGEKGDVKAQYLHIPLVKVTRESEVEFGGVLDSTLVAKPEVHVVMAANHVNPKL
jgi:hypothetical protein